MNAFTADPPTITIRGERRQLRPYTVGFQTKIVPAVKDMIEGEDVGSLGILGIVAFCVFHSMTAPEASALLSDKKAAEQAIDEAQMELSLGDIEAVSDYIVGIHQRTEAAQIVTDGVAGKQKAEETPRTS